MKAIVVAHPDDEILWLSSAVADADKIVFCYGDNLSSPKKSEARRRAVAALKLPNLISIALPESGTRLQVDWEKALETPYGISITDAAGRARYEANYADLVEKLRPVLAGCDEVYTHNPWGEYGHPEHIQAYRAVSALQKELGFTIWFSNYAATLTLKLAARAGKCRAERKQVQPDTRTARRMMWTYLRHGAWTWPILHRWPRTEFLYAQPPGPAENWRGMEGETLLDAQKLRLWRPESHSALRLKNSPA